MKKRHSKVKISQLIGIIGLSLLAAWLALSVILQNTVVNAGDAKFIFAGTHEDADCSILLSNGHCTVVDAGEEVDGAHIVELLKSCGINHIDYLIITHPDKDHIGAAPAILDSFEVGQVIVPYYGQYVSQYNSLLKKIDSLGIETVTLSDGKARQLDCGKLKLTLYPPEKTFYDNDNEYSIITLVRHGKVNLLLAGDAEKLRLAEVSGVDFPDIALLKVPYHGRSSNASADFIRRTSPEYAVVNAAKPESKIEKSLSKLGCKICCTVGTDWIFDSDGVVLSANSSRIG